MSLVSPLVCAPASSVAIATWFGQRGSIKAGKPGTQGGDIEVRRGLHPDEFRGGQCGVWVAFSWESARAN